MAAQEHLTLDQVGMKLDPKHYYFISPKMYTGFNNRQQSTGPLKPKGLWFACGREWIKFIKHGFQTGVLPDYKYVYEIKIDTTHILEIRTVSGLIKFSKKYNMDDFNIDWKRIQNDGYKGILICRYLMGKVFTEDEKRPKDDILNLTIWYYSWDIPSGVIWSGDTVTDVSLLYMRADKDNWKEVAVSKTNKTNTKRQQRRTKV